jgi:hypothetical protein
MSNLAMKIVEPRKSKTIERARMHGKRINGQVYYPLWVMNIILGGIFGKKKTADYVEDLEIQGIKCYHFKTTAWTAGWYVTKEGLDQIERMWQKHCETREIKKPRQDKVSIDNCTPEHLADPVIALYLGHTTYEDIARILNMPINQVILKIRNTLNLYD